MFTDKFDSYICVGDSITVDVNGFTVTARIVFDGDTNIDDCDSHNVDQRVTGCDDAQQAKLLAARKAWSDDEWFYCGVVLSVTKADIELTDHAASLWGIECNYPGSDNAYLADVANELFNEAMDTAHDALARLAA